MADGREEVQRLNTETHRLIKNKDWDAVNARLARDEGHEEAKTKDEQGRLIFHLEELYDKDVPTETIRAANDANNVGFVTKSDRDVHPMVLAIRKSRPQVVALLLQLHPNAAKKKIHKKYHRHLLHYACEIGQSIIVQLLLASYPAAASARGAYDNYPDYPLLLSQKCSFEAQLSLLVAYPDIAKQKMYGGRLLHYTLRHFDDYNISDSILQLYPEAATERNANGELPIHCAMHNPRVLSIEELALLIRGDSNVLAEADNSGKLPLHCLCYCVSAYDDFKDASSRQIELFREMHRQLPDAALNADNDDNLPFDWLLLGAQEDEEDLTTLSKKNANSSSFVEIWCSLVNAAPQSLHRRHLKESPFISLSKLCPPPTKIWDNAVKHYPAALRSLDRMNEGSSLSYSLKTRLPDELSDSSSYSYSILKSTFKCTRDLEFTQQFIEEDIPAMHMLLYCYHLLQYKTLCQYVLPSPKNQALRRLFSEKDSYLNTVLHMLCNAPCPKEKNDPETDEDGDDEDDEYEVKEKDEPSIVQDYINVGYTNRNERHMSSAANIFGDLPVHLLLRNRQPLFHEFNTVVGILMDWNKSAAAVADSKERMFPFMLAALNLAEREDKNEVCSLTYTLLLQFVALNDLNEFCSISMTKKNLRKCCASSNFESI